MRKNSSMRFAFTIVAWVALVGLVFAGPPFIPADPIKTTSGETFPCVQQVGGSCVIAAAANVLAAAGWGPAGKDAQQRTEIIYERLFQHIYGFSSTDSKASSVGYVIPASDAMNWYMQNHGNENTSSYNIVTTLSCSVQMQNKYDSGNTTIVGGAMLGDYTSLCGTLDKSNYIATVWRYPKYFDSGKGEWVMSGHCIAFVGGDPITTPGGQSSFMDSNGATKEDFVNTWIAGSSEWELLGFNYSPVTNHERLSAAYVLSPGTPDWVINEYNVTWDGTSFDDESLTETGTQQYAYDDPSWELIGTDVAVLNLDNIRVDHNSKQLFLELNFENPVDPATIDLPSNIWIGTLDSGMNSQLSGEWTFSENNTKAMLKWVFDPQPGSEFISFSRSFMDSDVLDTFSVATYCSQSVPEPTTICLLVTGMLFLLWRRRFS